MEFFRQRRGSDHLSQKEGRGKEKKGGEESGVWDEVGKKWGQEPSGGAKTGVVGNWKGSFSNRLEETVYEGDQ